jgi:hypothetical protein
VPVGKYDSAVLRPLETAEWLELEPHAASSTAAPTAGASRERRRIRRIDDNRNRKDIPISSARTDVRPRTRPLASRGHGEIAQLVEHTTENRGVPGSSPGLAMPRSPGNADFLLSAAGPSLGLLRPSLGHKRRNRDLLALTRASGAHFSLPKRTSRRALRRVPGLGPRCLGSRLYTATSSSPLCASPRPVTRGQARLLHDWAGSAPRVRRVQTPRGCHRIVHQDTRGVRGCRPAFDSYQIAAAVFSGQI